MNKPLFRDIRDLNDEQILFFRIEQIYSHIHGEPHFMELHERLMKLSVMNLDEDNENSYS